MARLGVAIMVGLGAGFYYVLGERIELKVKNADNSWIKMLRFSPLLILCTFGVGTGLSYLNHIQWELVLESEDMNDGPLASFGLAFTSIFLVSFFYYLGRRARESMEQYLDFWKSVG